MLDLLVLGNCRDHSKVLRMELALRMPNLDLDIVFSSSRSKKDVCAKPINPHHSSLISCK